MKKSPCYKCRLRCLLCHVHCKDYHDWVAQVRAEDAARRATMDADAHTKATSDAIRRRRGKW